MDMKSVVGVFLSTPIAKLSLRERRAHLWIAKMRRVPLFTQILDRMVKKESVRQIARWVYEQPDGMKGELAGCSEETIRGYLNCLNVEVNRARAHVVRLDLKDVRKAAVTEHLNAKVSAAVKGLPDTDGFDDIQKYVTQQIQKLDAATMLRYCFMIQQQRVRELRELEKATKVLMPSGDKALRVLAEIAAQVWKVEAGEALLRAKNVWVKPLGEVPREVEPEVAEAMAEIAKLDRVDQNLIRDATIKVMDLIEQEAGVGQYRRRDREQPNVKGIDDVPPNAIANP